MTGLAQNLSFILLGEDRTASKTMTAAQKTAEVVTGRIGSSFSKLGGIIGGEFGNVLEQAGSSVDKLGSKGAKLSSTLEVGGAVTTAAGIGLMQLGSGAKQSTDQLNQAIKDVGDSTDKYADSIDKAVAKGESFDHNAEDTKDALAKLIPAAGSTQKALDQMGVVTDLAAAKHISLTDAAGLVAKILGGSGAKTLTQYGITMEKVADPTKALAAAQAGVTSASDTLAAAQKRLADLQEIDAGKKKLTISDHVALANAQDAVTAASGKLSTAQDKLAGTSTEVVTKTQAGQDALDQLSKKLNGQASASVNNFGSQFDIVKTKVEDFVKDAAGPVGNVMTLVGPIFSVAGLAVDWFTARQEKATIATIAQTAAAADATVATEAETGAMVGLDGAMDANPIGIVAGAIAGLAAIVGGGLLIGGMNNATISVEALTSALNLDNDAIGANTRATITNALIKDGSLKAAQDLGISTNLVVSAVLGEKGAREELNAEIDKAKSSYVNLNDTQGAQLRVTTSLTGAAAATRDNVNLLTDAVGGGDAALKTALTNIGLYKGGMDDTGLSAAIASGKVGALSDALNRLGGSSPAAAVKITVDSRKVPKTATGGIVTSTQTRVVGESGPEAIIPLNSGRNGMLGVDGLGRGGGGANINITLAPQGLMSGTPQQLAQQLMTLLINGTRNGNSATELKRALGIHA